MCSVRMSMPASTHIWTLVVAGLLISVHVWGKYLSSLRVIPRSRWLSGASGIAVAYVFVHILPELAANQEWIESGARWGTGFVEHHVYLIAMVGLGTFYGLERVVKRSSSRRRADTSEDDRTGAGVFWLHVGSFAAMNLLIGYLLLHREEQGLKSLLIYGVAMSTHFLVNDIGLRADHRLRYDRVGRWVLAGAALVGVVVGELVEVSRGRVAVLFAFLAGGVMLNVLKEELPAERESNFGAFLGGAAGFAVLLLAA